MRCKSQQNPRGKETIGRSFWFIFSGVKISEFGNIPRKLIRTNHIQKGGAKLSSSYFYVILKPLGRKNLLYFAA